MAKLSSTQVYGNLNVDGEITNPSLDLDRTHLCTATASSTNVYVLTTRSKSFSLQEGASVKFKVPSDSTGACTANVDGTGAKSIKKPNGKDATNMKAGAMVTLNYNGSVFTLQGEGGSGNATAADILTGKTATNDAGDVTGTLPLRGNTGGNSGKNHWWTPFEVSFAEGYLHTRPCSKEGRMAYIGDCWVSTPQATVASQIGLTGAKLAKGQTVCGIAGTFTSDANAGAGDMLSGKTAYVNGNKVTGTIVDRGTYQTVTTVGTGNGYYALNNIPQGYYHKSSANESWAPEIRISAANLASALGITAGRIANGVTICGVTGSFSNYKGICNTETGTVTSQSGKLTKITGLSGGNEKFWWGSANNVSGAILPIWDLDKLIMVNYVHSSYRYIAFVFNPGFFRSFESSGDKSSFALMSKVLRGDDAAAVTVTFKASASVNQTGTSETSIALSSADVGLYYSDPTGKLGTGSGFPVYAPASGLTMKYVAIDAKSKQTDEYLSSLLKP